MRHGLCILWLLLLSGCALGTKDLVDNGEWTLQDERSEPLDDYEDQRRQWCPRGTRLWCNRHVRDETCKCINNRDFEDRLRSILH